jgi:hypothetical protein
MRTDSLKRTITGILLTTIVVGAMAVVPPRANAQFLSGFTYTWETNPALLTPVTETSVAATENAAGTTAGWASQAAEWVYEKAIKIVLERLKKRLLDTITDQIIAWIQYGTEPQFISNFGDVLTDAADAAVGDTIREVGLGEFCSPSTGPLLSLALRQQRGRFSSVPSCTLSKVIANVEGFADDFSQGGWLGLQTLANPENNKYGQFIIVSERLQRLTGAKQQAAQTESQANNGFTSSKQCVEWRRLVLKRDGTSVEEILSPGVSQVGMGYFWIDEFYNLSTPPTSAIRLADAAPLGYVPGNYLWTCERTEVTTPGTVVQEGANRAIYSDIDYLIGSTELSTYLGAIADAALNRLTTEAYKGLRGMMQSQTTNPTGTVPPYTTPAAVGAAGAAYNTGLAANLEQSRQTLLTNVGNALTNAQADLQQLPSLRSGIVGFLGGTSFVQLSACLRNCPSVPELNADKAWVSTATTTIMSASSTLRGFETGGSSIASTIAALTTLRTQLTLMTGSNLTAANLAALNTSAVATANSNHAAVVGIASILRSTGASLSIRLTYCNGDLMQSPPIYQCTPYPGQ